MTAEREFFLHGELTGVLLREPQRRPSKPCIFLMVVGVVGIVGLGLFALSQWEKFI